MDASTRSMLESRSKAQVQACMGCHHAAALRRLHGANLARAVSAALWQLDIPPVSGGEGRRVVLQTGVAG